MDGICMIEFILQGQSKISFGFNPIKNKGKAAFNLFDLFLFVH